MSDGVDNCAMQKDDDILLQDMQPSVVSSDQVDTGNSVTDPSCTSGEEPVEHSSVIAVDDTAPSDAQIPVLLFSPDEGGTEIVLALQEFVSKKQGSKIEQHKSKKVRSYYKKQDELIESFEELSKEDSCCHDSSLGAAERSRKIASFYSKVTFGVNLLLVTAKLTASILSDSISIITSLVDSIVDLLSGIIMWRTTIAIKRRNPYKYPQGRTKLEPVSIIILSLVMALVSLQLIREAATKIATLVSDDTVLPDMGIPTIVLGGSAVVTKFILWRVCRKIDSPIVRALALDHRNDAMSISLAIVCGYLGSKNFQEQLKVHAFIFADPVGAILINLYIISEWWEAGSKQVKMLTGYTAGPDFLSKVTWIALHHDPNITHIDTVQAYHSGHHFLVRVDIVLPEYMCLRETHDIGESLQRKLENIPEVERAFVHVDYEFSHKPSSEHKIV